MNATAAINLQATVSAVSHWRASLGTTSTLPSDSGAIWHVRLGLGRLPCHALRRQLAAQFEENSQTSPLMIKALKP